LTRIKTDKESPLHTQGVAVFAHIKAKAVLMKNLSPVQKTKPHSFKAACLAALLGVVLGDQAFGAVDAPSQVADQMLARVKSGRGVAVVVGDRTGAFSVRLARETEFLIYLQLPDTEEVDVARRLADSQGLYGRRVFIDRGPDDTLQLADNLADVLCALGPVNLPEAEALRVLRPEGRAFLRNKELVKPFPAGVDDWRHPYHGPDNNPASNDQLAKGPYLTHFLSDPRYAPLPQVALASAGRVFKLFGHIAFKEREEPWLNTMAAFNGYNGTLLWRRDIPAGLMIHRNTFIATPTAVYFGDDQSCKVIDAATGQVRDEIVPPADAVDGTFWKWMALEGGVLYATVGEQEQRDPNIRMRSDKHGWPWDPLSPGFNQPENPWGYGRCLVAIDPETKSVRWQHREAQPFDSRATCMRNGRLFIYRQGDYLACLDASTGRELWRKTAATAPEVFQALGVDLPRQDWRTNWRTTAYVKCSDQALYFAGPTVNHLLALSANDGHILWQHPYSNYQLVLEPDGLYALSGQIDTELSRKFEPMTGRVLEEIKLGRRACTRPTGAIDAIFCRANGGSTRLGLDKAEPQLVSPMRAQCQDGVTVANGLLYWWPSVCDCNLTLYGITCLGPAGAFDFNRAATDADRLEHPAIGAAAVAALPVGPADWPTFRANNTASAQSDAAIPSRVQRLWQTVPAADLTPTAPTAVDGLIFVSGSDGVVKALDARSGAVRWTAYTGGSVRFPPTVWNGRVFVGSGDGWAYSFEARTGRLLWRFRAAPVERKIPVYGQLLSTWPVASGVVVQDGVAYVAAGIVNYDGTHVYALDATTGQIRWQNNASGHLDPDAIAGVSVQGHMILHDGKLWLAGGNVVSPGVYDLKDGRCLSDLNSVHRLANNNVLSSESPRGSELYLLAGQVMVSDQPLYAHPKYKVYDSSVLAKTWAGSTPTRDVLWVNNTKVLCYPRLTEKRAERLAKSWGNPRVEGVNPVWETEFRDSVAVAMGRNALVVVRPSEIIAYQLETGRPLWNQMLPGTPVPWGLALDRAGRAIVSMEGGQVVCFGGTELTASK
jgi:outer membrane protein assembly factor BamB